MSPAQTPVAKEWFIEGMVGNLGYLILISLENLHQKTQAIKMLQKTYASTYIMYIYIYNQFLSFIYA